MSDELPQLSTNIIILLHFKLFSSSIPEISLEIAAYLCKVIKIIATFAKNRNEMKVERETAGFALPFTAGVLMAVYSGAGISSGHIYSPIAALILVVICLYALIHPSGRSSGRAVLTILTGAAALGAGMVCGFTADSLSISAMRSDISIYAEEYGATMQAAIDRIPFADKDCNALAKALLTGERSDIPKEIVSAFRDSGASHILALSGLHLGIIYSIIAFLTSVFGNGRKAKMIRAAICVTSCGFYTLATGAGPSIVRALIFIFLAESSRLIYRHITTGQLLFSSLIIQLTIDPLAISSVSFQLSYAAMAGIAFILPILKRLWPGSIYKDRRAVRWIRKIWESAAMSISCQLTTAPLAYLYFGSFPSCFLISNLISLPLTGIVIPAVIFTLILHCLGICPDFVIEATGSLISALIGSLDIIASMG